MKSQSEEVREQWFRSRIPAYRAGLLEDADIARFETLRTELPRCSQIWDLFDDNGAPSSEDPGHIPASMIARWDRIRSGIHGLERHLLREHLTACAQCTAEVRFIGYEPDLPDFVRIPRLSSHRGRRVLRRVWSARREWGIAWAAAATLACVYLAIAGVSERRRRLVPAAPAASEVRALPWIEPQALRRSGSGDTLRVPAAAREILLPILIPTLVDGRAGVECVIVAPDGRIVHSLRLPAPQNDRRLMLMVSSPAGFAPGTYRVRFLSASGDLAPLYEATFTIRIQP